MNDKKIILVGKAASGKDYFKDFLINEGFRASISHTTRPIRKGERDGKTYHFVDNNEFEYLINKGNFFEWKTFNGWYYGTSKKEWLYNSVFIFTPGGVETLPKESLYNSIIVYFDIPDDIRIDRLYLRSDADSIERRIISDEKDFQSFTNYDIHVTDSEFDCEQLLEQIKIYMQ